MIVARAHTILIVLVDAVDPPRDKLMLHAVLSKVFAAARTADPHLAILLLVQLKFLRQRLDHFTDLFLLIG